MDNNYNTDHENDQNNQNNINQENHQNTQSQSGDSFYSYHRDTENQAGQNTSQTGSYQNTAGNQSQSYGTQANDQYGNQGSQYNPYGNSSSQNTSYGAGSANYYGNTAGSYGNAQNQHYGNSAYGSQNQGYGYYGNANGQQNQQHYQSNAYGTGAAPKPQKKKRERKLNGFGKQLAKCAALALVFGLVAGGVMTGVNYGASKALGTGNSGSSQAALTTSDGSSIKSTAVSSTYTATDVSDIVDEVMPSIVAITNVSQTEYQSFWGGQPQTYESTSCGSGIIVSKDNDYLYIATNNHVVEKATSLTVTFSNGDTVSAEVKGTDPSTDLAVVKVELSSIKDDTMSAIKVATLGSSDALKVGESCIAIGNALGYGQSVTTGVISALNREVSVSDSSSNTSYTAALIQTDAAINPGNSGGALLDTAGEVIGINSVKYSDTSVEGIGYAIPMDTAKPIIEELITKEKVDESNSAYLGIAGVDVTSDVASTYNMPTGVYVAQVVEGGAAEQAGIQKGDIITTFDGKNITSMKELSSTLQYYAAGTKVDVVVQRASNGQYEEQTISVTLGKKN